MARVALVFGGRSVEHQVSVRSARTVRRGLEAGGHEVVPLGIAEDGCWVAGPAAAAALDGDLDFLAPVGAAVAPTLAALLESGADVVFPLVHGTWGEDGSLQGLCEMADLPYVGAGVTASAVAMDKLLTKRLLEAAGIEVVEYAWIDRAEWAADRSRALARLTDQLAYPLFVKPAVGGSSVGVARLEDGSCLESSVGQALELDERALVERAVAGRELECALIGYPALEASAVGEIRPGHAFYDYADKYLEDGAEILVPADLEPGVAAAARELAVAAFAVLGGTGMARVDFFLEPEGRLLVNEINTLPGFTSISMYPKLWQAAGVGLAALVERLVAEGLARHRDRTRIEARIKEFLAELGG